MSLASALDRFFRHDAAGGIVLMVSAVLALIVANSALTDTYHGILNTYFAVTFGGEGIEKALILWINDGLMAIFFFLIGLELKREMLEGKLKNPRDVILPGAAAVGGMAVPSLIYAVINWTNPETVHGWAIPAATDIAFAVGVMALLGNRIPAALKVFLLTLAILDDLGAILIIALFYTADLKVDYLFLALLPLAGLWYRNWKGYHRVAPSILLGIILWIFVLKSGVHATLAGVITAFFIPLKDKYGKSPLHAIEDSLSDYVFFLIVPIFAFANAGVVLTGITWDQVFSPVVIGIVLGLYFGKKIGVFGMTWILVKTGIAKLPYGVTWRHIYGVSCLAGIGFTMSLFIGGLSFGDGSIYMNEVRIGVLAGSILSAITGFIVLRSIPVAKAEKADRADPHAEVDAKESPVVQGGSH